MKKQFKTIKLIALQLCQVVIFHAERIKSCLLTSKSLQFFRDDKDVRRFYVGASIWSVDSAYHLCSLFCDYAGCWGETCHVLLQ